MFRLVARHAFSAEPRHTKDAVEHIDSWLGVEETASDDVSEEVVVEATSVETEAVAAEVANEPVADEADADEAAEE